MNDSVLYDSKVLGDSFLIELMQPLFAGGLEEGFALMGEGDSAAFVVSADSIFEKLFRTQLPPFMHKGDKMRFDVRLRTKRKKCSHRAKRSFTNRKLFGAK
jgi:hypothetical protein